MRRTLIMLGVLALIMAVTLPVAAWLGEGQFARQSGQAFQALEAAASTPAPPPPSPAGSPLPPAVERYLERLAVGPPPRVHLVRLETEGRIRVTEEAGWDRFQARQVVSLRPAGMVWAGRIDYAPWTPLLVLQSWQEGRARVVSSLWGSLSLFRREGREVLRAAMLRWLGEAVWYPAALLPGAGVHWEESGAKQEATYARAVFTSRGHRVAGRFRFDPGSGLPVEFVSEPEADGKRWYAAYGDWRRVAGLLVPFQVTEGVALGGLRQPRLEVGLTRISHP